MGNSSIIIAISLLLVAFLLTVVMLPKLIKYLHYLKFGQEIRQEGPQSHIHKRVLRQWEEFHLSWQLLWLL